MRTVKQFIFTIILFLSSNPTWAYDFTTVQGENTFFFTITSNTNPYTVKVVSENQSEPYYTDTATTPVSSQHSFYRITQRYHIHCYGNW